MIDSADPSIVSNQTTIRTIYTLVPAKGIQQRINFSFSNPLARPLRAPYIVNETECIKSSPFDYFKDGVYYNSTTPQGQVTLSDDGNGFIRLYYIMYDKITDTVVQQILETNLGTVNYDTGELAFDLNPYDYDTNIKIFAKVINDDIVVQESKYLKIDYDEIGIAVSTYRQ
jgi:hypothetical protein